LNSVVVYLIKKNQSSCFTFTGLNEHKSFQLCSVKTPCEMLCGSFTEAEAEITLRSQVTFV